MSEFEPLIESVRSQAQSMISRTAELATEASGKINEDRYTATDLMQTMAALVDLTVRGSVELSRTVLRETPASGRQVAGYTNTVAARMAQQAQIVAEAAAAKIGAGRYSVDDAVVTATRFADIALVGAMEIGQTVLIGPAPYDDQPIEIELHAAAAEQPRELRAHIRRFGDPNEAEIPASAVSFDPPTLDPGVQDFRLRVVPFELASGVYVGTVDAGDEAVHVEFAL